MKHSNASVHIKKVIVYILFALICFTGLIVSIRFSIGLLAICIAAAYLVAYKIHIPKFYLLLFAVSLIIRVLYVNLVNTQPGSDFKVIYEAAVSFAKGDYSFNQFEYFKDWAYQTGFVVYQGLVIKLAGVNNALMVLKLLNCLWAAGINVLIYLIAKNYVQEAAARFTSLLYMVFVFPLTFVSVLTNQHLSAFLILLGLFVLSDPVKLKMHVYIKGILAGVFIALGNIMRPEGIVILGSIFLYIIISLIKPIDENRKTVLIKALLLLAAYFAINMFASNIIINKGINPEGLKNNNFLWKFVIGLNHETNGIYSDKDSWLVNEQQHSKEAKIQQEIKLIKERLLTNPLKLGRLIIVKYNSLWCDSALYWSYGYLLEGEGNISILGSKVDFKEVDNLLQGLHGGMLLLILLFNTFTALTLLKKPVKNTIYMYVIILLISFFIYILIEVQPRYVYLQYTVMFVTAALGMEALIGKLQEKLGTRT